MSEELIYLSAVELVARYAKGDLSPVEVTEAVLTRIDAVDGTLNAFRLVDSEAAMAEARASEARWRRAEPKGLVDGAPSPIKEGATKEEAEDIKKQLEEAGGSAELK